MRCTVKDWPFGLSYDDLEERLEEQGLKWSEDKKLFFWKSLCSGDLSTPDRESRGRRCKGSSRRTTSCPLTT